MTAADWLALAGRRSVVGRALRVAALVGSVLVVINHADRLLAGTMVAADWLKVALTYCVPYCVATYSAVAALGDASAGRA